MLVKGTSTQVEKAASHETLMPLLEATYREMQELAKKKPDGPVSPNKIKIVNRLLNDVFKILVDEPSRPYLDLLDDDEVPQNSDAVLVLSQVVAAMNRFEEQYYRYDPARHSKRWFVDEA